MALNTILAVVIRVIIGLTIIVMFIKYTPSSVYMKKILFHDIFNRSVANKVLPTNSTRNSVNISKGDINNITISEEYIRQYIGTANEQLEIHWLRVIKHFLRFPLDRGYGSHQAVLLATSILTAGGGPILEMGCGFFSTVLLRQIIVVEQKRHLLSTDTDFEWLSKFEKNMSSTLHQFQHIKATSEWDSMSTNRSKWSFVLVDHKPGERRATDIARMVDMSDIVILHDTEVLPIDNRTGLAFYPYRYRYKYIATHTDVMSKNNATIINNIQRLLELTIKMKLPKS